MSFEIPHDPILASRNCQVGGLQRGTTGVAGVKVPNDRLTTIDQTCVDAGAVELGCDDQNVDCWIAGLLQQRRDDKRGRPATMAAWGPCGARCRLCRR